MELIEIRDLDGPNLFALVPTIKLEVSLSPGEVVEPARVQAISELLNHEVPENPAEALCALVIALHERIDLSAPGPLIHRLDLPDHLAVFYPWEWRTTAVAIAQTAFDLIAGNAPNDIDTLLNGTYEHDCASEDRPTWVRDEERRIPIAAITGTNGKTTTTRLLTHIMREAGQRVGWSSSTGVYINGEPVLEGDYTGHGGARRVLTDPNVDCGVLETARGGILLRGLGFESNNVGVFLNVSADHLNLHGVTRLETLARAKSTVVRVTHADGVVVLNADDPLVLAQRENVVAEPVLISRQPDSPSMREHLGSGGRAVTVRDGEIALEIGDRRLPITPLSAVPLTYHGAAGHMVENALAAVAAAVGLGVQHEQIRLALQSFHPDPEHNSGRLNVFEVGGRTIVLDYAHNESGLGYLLDFASQLLSTASRRTAVVGTAGDREDAVFVRLGALAAQRADRVLLKENPRFHRGREPGEALSLLEQGIHASSSPEPISGTYEREYDATIAALDTSEPGEAILVMCIEDYAEIMEELDRRGARIHSLAQPAGGD